MMVYGGKRIRFFLALLPGAFLLFFSCGSRESGTFPQTQDITQAVYASGYIKPESEYQVYAQSEGVITEILKQDGDSVVAGEIIIKIKSNVQDAKKQSALEALELAGMNAGSNSPVLEEAIATLNSLSNKLVLDSINFIRYKNLMQSNSTARIEFDKAELVYKNSINEVRAARARVTRLKKQAETEYALALAQLSGTEDEKGNTCIRSQFDGLVYEVHKEPGEVVRRGEVIARVGSSKNMILELRVDEEDYSLVQKDQKVLYTADAYGTQVMEAHIVRKYPSISKSDQSFRVDAVPVDNVLSALSGAAAEANIIVSQKKNALVVPASFIDSGDSLVIDANKGKRKVKVKTGIRDLEFVEVLEGITKSTRIFKD